MSPDADGSEMKINAEKNTSAGKTNWQLILLIIFLVLWLLTSIVAVYLYLQTQEKKTQENLPASTGPKIVLDTSPTPTEPPQGQLTSLDDMWNMYTNYNLGFSMKIPKTIYHNFGECEWKSEEDSYRPKLAEVPVEVFEDEQRAFITSEYFYTLTGERVENDRHFYSGCEKVENSLSDLQNADFFQQTGWEIIAKDVSTDAQLTEFIKENYGQGCSLGEKEASSQEGVFDVKIDSGGYENMEEAEAAGCLVNYIYYLKYFPEKERAITWKFGQAYSFYKNAQYDAYDEDMVESFRMID